MLPADASITLSVRTDCEHAVLAETGDLTVNGAANEHRELAYVPPGADTLTIDVGADGGRAVLLGGVPLGEEIIMWWNFVGRTHEEIDEFRRRYQAELGFADPDPRDAGKPELFGPYAEGQLPPWPAPTLPNTRLKPRRNR